MRYAPIGNEREALDRINGLGFDQYIIASYEEDWQRGEPEIERTTDIAHAVETFFDLWGVILCVELRGVDLDGSEYPVCIGGTAPDLSEEGEYIKE